MRPDILPNKIEELDLAHRKHVYRIDGVRHDDIATHTSFTPSQEWRTNGGHPNPEYIVTGMRIEDGHWSHNFRVNVSDLFDQLREACKDEVPIFAPNRDAETFSSHKEEYEAMLWGAFEKFGLYAPLQTETLRQLRMKTHLCPHGNYHWDTQCTSETF